MCVRRPGRPRSTHCKRGHERVHGEKSCIACRRYRERLKYDSNPEFKQRKLQYQRQWRKEFFEKNGYWASNLYERKPKYEHAA